MTEIKNPADYSVTQKALHWLIGVAIIIDLFVAQKFGGVMTDFDRFESRSDHASLGTLVACLLILRIYLRYKNGAPALPGSVPSWQKRMAHSVHWVLYALIFTLIASGIGSAINADSLVTPFGLFAYGDGIGDTDVFSFIRTIHEFATNAIIILIALHVGAALYHLTTAHRKLTLSMLRFWKSERSV